MNVKLQTILSRYQVTPDYNFLSSVDPLRKDGFDKSEADLVYRGLKERWKDRIEPGWYGFDMTLWPPVNWYYAVNEFLSWLESVEPKFTIHQIKLKFGQLRIHVQLPSEDPIIKQSVLEFANRFSDKKLIY